MRRIPLFKVLRLDKFACCQRPTRHKKTIRSIDAAGIALHLLIKRLRCGPGGGVNHSPVPWPSVHTRPCLYSQRVDQPRPPLPFSHLPNQIDRRPVWPSRSVIRLDDLVPPAIRLNSASAAVWVSEQVQSHGKHSNRRMQLRTWTLHVALNANWRHEIRVSLKNFFFIFLKENCQNSGKLFGLPARGAT